MATKPTKSSTPQSFLNKVSVYGLEFAIAMVTMAIALVVVTIAIFALFNLIADPRCSEMGYAALWVSASAIVWVPVAYIFYMRSRGHEQSRPEITNHPAQRAFVMIYQVCAIIAVIAFAIAAVYSGLLAAVQPQNTGDTLLRVTAPSVVAALVFFGAFTAFFKHPIVSRKLYAGVFAGVSAVVVIAVIVFSIVALRSSSGDGEKVAALDAVQSAVNQYANDHDDNAPTSLADIDSYLSDAGKKVVKDISYERVDGNRYQLCTDFSRASKKNDNYRVAPTSTQYYTSYPNFDQHGDGRQCFKVRVSSSSFMLD